jgi:D-aspartate ligase
VTSAAPLRALHDGTLAFTAGADAPTRRLGQAGNAPLRLHLSLHSGLAGIETQWRRFENLADCTPFQTYDWLQIWHRHIGLRERVRPVIATASFPDGAIAFMLPLAVECDRAVRRLCWLGQDLNDYNGPLLARDFSERVSGECFLAAWDELRVRMQSDAMLRHDWIELEKMPQVIGGQLNPFFNLALATNPSGAHFTRLDGEWNKFYAAKRSSATRRRDRSKRKRLAELGEIEFVTCAESQDAKRTLQTLMAQKHRLFARRGIPDMFARPGWREFFLDIATNPATRRLTHISRVQIGETCAAANLGIVFGDSYYHMLASYDDGPMAHYGPGALHLRDLLAYAIGRGLRRYDFTIGDESYKLEWSDAHIKLGDYATAATWRGWPAYARSMLRRPLKRVIKQTPWMWRAVSHGRAYLGPFLRRSAPATVPQSPGTVVAMRSALACVMGDMDLLRPIALAGIGCAVVSRPGSPSLYSRYAQSRLGRDDFSDGGAALVEELVRFGEAQPEPPVLFYEEDVQLLMVSRFREPLARALRFVIAETQLVDDLLDKGRFQILAERHGLPVPPSRRFRPAAFAADELELRFPVVLKPLTRLQRWNETFAMRKALAAESADALRALWPQLVAVDIDLLAQELIPGPEAQIESYHCYVDPRGSIAGEFTGRKIRTYPETFGHTTALEITDAADVQRQGRAIAERLGLTGVAKFDFKRGADGRLHLLEINPRFNLWHHAGALAGVNIPAIVYADLTGGKRPRTGQARAGVRWCRVWKDLPAARIEGVPLTAWMSWVWRCEAKSSLSWDDPLPPAQAALHRLVGGRGARGSLGSEP